VITWISLFDLGLTNGLRNKITEAVAKEDYKLVREYLSTTYVILIICILPVWVLFLSICDFIQWQRFFNTQVDAALLNTVLKWTFSAFCLQIILQPINAFLMAIHKHYLSAIITLAGNMVALITIVRFGNYFDSSLLFLSLTLSMAPLLCSVISSIILFSGKYANSAPGLKYVHWIHKKELFNLGFKFFLIQVAGLVIFASNNIIISRLEGNEQVTVYNIVLRFFGIVSLFQSLILAPLWTGYTDAYTLTDFNWIRRAIKKINLLNWSLCILLLIMVFISNFIYKIWINEHFSAPFSLNLLMARSIGAGLFATNYTIFINGTGKILMQTYISVIVGLLHVPLAFFLMQSLKMGINGLVVLNIIWMTLSILLWINQYKKILSNSSSVLWNS
jgi:O-antigen/teichoic acid export membrane protein